MDAYTLPALRDNAGLGDEAPVMELGDVSEETEILVVGENDHIVSIITGYQIRF